MSTGSGSGRARLASTRNFVERVLELLAGFELCRTAGEKLWLFPGFLIAPGARLPLEDRKCPEARDVHSLTLLECVDDVIEHDVDRSFGFAFIQPKLVGQTFDQIGFGHVIAPTDPSSRRARH